MKKLKKIRANVQNFVGRHMFNAQCKMEEIATSEEGSVSIEAIVIAAILIAVAFIFRNAIIDFVTRLIDQVFGKDVSNLAIKY